MSQRQGQTSLRGFNGCRLSMAHNFAARSCLLARRRRTPVLIMPAYRSDCRTHSFIRRIRTLCAFQLVCPSFELLVVLSVSTSRLYILWFSFCILIQYLNSGAGGIAGAFVHRKHHHGDHSHLHGWWGNRAETRFEMRHNIDLPPETDAYRLCNPPPSLVALHKAGLEVAYKPAHDSQSFRLT